MKVLEDEEIDMAALRLIKAAELTEIDIPETCAFAIFKVVEKDKLKKTRSTEQRFPMITGLLRSRYDFAADLGP